MNILKRRDVRRSRTNGRGSAPGLAVRFGLFDDFARCFRQMYKAGPDLDTIEQRIECFGEDSLLDLLAGLQLGPVASRRCWHTMAGADFRQTDIRNTKVCGELRHRL